MATMFGEGYDMPILDEDGFPITVGNPYAGEGATQYLTEANLWGTGAGGGGALQTVRGSAALAELASGANSIEDVIQKIPTFSNYLADRGVTGVGGDDDLNRFVRSLGLSELNPVNWEDQLLGPYFNRNSAYRNNPNLAMDSRYMGVWDFLDREGINNVNYDTFKNALTTLNKQYGGLANYGNKMPVSAADWAVALGATGVTPEELANSRATALARGQSNQSEDWLDKIGPLPFLLPLAGMALPAMFGTAGAGAAAGAAGAGDLGLFNALPGGASWAGGAGGLTGGAGALGGAMDAYSGFGDVFGELGGSISDSLGGVYGGLDNLGAYLGDVFSGAQSPLGGLSNIFSGLGGANGGLLSSVLGGLGGLGGGGGGGNTGSLLGALLGGLGGYLGTPDDGETTVTQAPWGPQQPYLLNAFNQAGNLLNTQSAWQNPLLDPAVEQMRSTIAGDYLTPESNPYLADTVQSALDQVTGQVNRQFGTGENYGGSAHQEWLGRSLADTALPYYMQNYGMERGRQFGAAGMAPQFTQSYFGAQAAPLQNYTNIVGQGYGSQVTQPYFTNPWAGAAGGALAGYGLGGYFG